MINQSFSQRRGIDDWDHDNWSAPPQRPVNRQPSSSGYSSGYSSSNAVQGQNVQFRGQKIEQGNFIVTHNDFLKALIPNDFENSPFSFSWLKQRFTFY